MYRKQFVKYHEIRLLQISKNAQKLAIHKILKFDERKVLDQTVEKRFEIYQNNDLKIILNIPENSYKSNEFNQKKEESIILFENNSYVKCSSEMKL